MGNRKQKIQKIFNALIFQKRIHGKKQSKKMTHAMCTYSTETDIQDRLQLQTNLTNKKEKKLRCNQRRRRRQNTATHQLDKQERKQILCKQRRRRRRRNKEAENNEDKRQSKAEKQRGSKARCRGNPLNNSNTCTCILDPFKIDLKLLFLGYDMPNRRIHA